jgi:hypothetical protein
MARSLPNNSQRRQPVWLLTRSLYGIVTVALQACGILDSRRAALGAREWLEIRSTTIFW